MRPLFSPTDDSFSRILQIISSNNSVRCLGGVQSRLIADVFNIHPGESRRQLRHSRRIVRELMFQFDDFEMIEYLNPLLNTGIVDEDVSIESAGLSRVLSRTSVRFMYASRMTPSYQAIPSISANS